MQNKHLLKWGTTGILALSVIFIFLPYYSAYGYTETVIETLRYGAGDWFVDIILRFIVPVGFILLAAVMMALHYSMVKCVTAAVFSGIALFLYFFISLDYLFIGPGIIGNVIIALIGVVLPIVNIIFRKMTEQETEANVVMN